MLGFFKSKQNSEHKSKSNNISLIQVTKSDNTNNNTSDNLIKKSTNSIDSTDKLKSIEITSQSNISNNKQSIFSISFSKKDAKSIKKQQQQNTQAVQSQTNNSINKDDKNKKTHVSSVFSMIIDNKSEESNASSDSELQMFDPEPAPDETDTFNHATFIENKSFIEDDEVNEITSRKLNGLAKENNCYTVNEVPEGRLSKLSSSRASSRASSMASDSTRGSSNVFGEQKLPEENTIQLNDKIIDKKPDSSAENSEGSFGKASNTNTTNGSKNILLDALIRKFNVSMDIDTNSDNNSDSVSQAKTVPLQKQAIRYMGDDKKKKQSDLQRKINRSNLEKATTSKNVSTDMEDKVDATSCSDDDPKQVKVVKSTATQISRSLNKRNTTNQTICVTKLPQHFECKYIGKTKCQGLWGLKHIREPVDYLVQKARHLRSLEDLVDVEALISEKGIYIVQKSKPSTSKDESSNNKSTQKYYKSGLLPISNISYAVQDNIFGKVFSCIIVNEKNGKTVSECYSFLCRKNDTARKMALSITLAFKEYGKLLQFKETRINRTIQMNNTPSEINGDSFA